MIFMKLTPILFVLVFLLVTLLLVGAAVALNLLFDFSVPDPEYITADGEGEAEEGSRYPCIVIDAGHGGEDGGAPGPNGINEKDLTLAVSEILADMLRASGYDVVLTRTEDTMMSDGSTGSRKMQDMRYRLQVAGQTPDALFVSIHMNRFPQASCRGLQVYYSSNSPQSEELAKIIQDTVTEMLQPENHRATKAAGSTIYLLDRLQSPAVLVECGFLSNPEEAAMLADPDYQQQLAFVLCTAILNYSV